MVRFLGYVGAHRECEWKMNGSKLSEPKSVRYIQVFIRFANFHRQFIQGFCMIAAPLTSMLRMSLSTGSSENSTPIAAVVGDDEVDGGGLTD